MSSPAIGLVVDRAPAAALRDLLGELRRWARPIVADSNTPTPRAWITTSPMAATANDAPRAVWIADRDELDHPGAADAAVLLTDDPALPGSTKRCLVLVGHGSINVSEIPALTPYVRGRFRRSRGLPEELLVVVSSEGAWLLPDYRPLAPTLTPTAVALACAAVVRDATTLVDAFAWGTPCVTDTGTAAAVGAVSGEHVVVAAPASAAAEAGALAADTRRAAALSRKSRRLVETVHDRAGAARRVAHELGLTLGQRGRISTGVLDELYTPRHSRIRERVGAAVAGFENRRGPE